VRADAAPPSTIVPGCEVLDLLRISDEFAAIERAAERAKWRSYELYMWLGREEIKRQQRAGRP
jgi:hypothetical protein